MERAQTLDPKQPPDNCHEPLNPTLDAEHAHVGSRFNWRIRPGAARLAHTYASPPSSAFASFGIGVDSPSVTSQFAGAFTKAASHIRVYKGGQPHKNRGPRFPRLLP